MCLDETRPSVWVNISVSPSEWAETKRCSTCMILMLMLLVIYAIMKVEESEQESKSVLLPRRR
jgi:hypothetical protein